MNLAQLRAELLRFCRPEAGLITLNYAGLYRTLQLPCTYLHGLDALAPVFVANDPRWVGDLQSASSIPGTVALIGSAAAPPAISLLGGASGGTVSAITLSNGGYADLYLQLLFTLSIAAGDSVQIDVASRRVLRSPGGSALGTLLAGSQLASFFLYPGINTLALTKTGTVTASLQYNARYWSWEDADG